MVHLKVCELVKRFGKSTAVNKLSIEAVDDWNCLGILGRNGAGKTTFLRMLVGLLRPDGGQIALTYDGRTIDHADSRVATYVSDRCRLIGGLTGIEHFRLYESMNCLVGVHTDVDLRNDLVQRLSVEEQIGKALRSMSKGTRRKIEVIAAVSSTVPLVIADELTEGLDFPSRVVLEELLKYLAALGKRFIVSSHDLSFISSVADRIAIIDHGRCIDVLDKDSEVDLKARAVALFEQAAPENSGSP